MNEPISGGYILLSRKLLASGIMEKPPLYLKLWIWMLMQASFKDHGDLKRAQFFTSYSRMQGAMKHMVGYRPVKPTVKEMRGVMKFLTKSRMIVIAKVIHGMVITISNYNYYQDFNSYEGHSEGQGSGHNEGTISRKKGINKENMPFDYSDFKSRYSDLGLIELTLSAFTSTRKNGHVADSVLIKFFRWCEKYPVGQVETGCRTYLDKKCAADGKNEKYLKGIIRQSRVPDTSKRKTPEWL